MNYADLTETVSFSLETGEQPERTKKDSIKENLRPSLQAWLVAFLYMFYIYFKTNYHD